MAGGCSPDIDCTVSWTCRGFENSGEALTAAKGCWREPRASYVTAAEWQRETACKLCRQSTYILLLGLGGSPTIGISHLQLKMAGGWDTYARLSSLINDKQAKNLFRLSAS